MTKLFVPGRLGNKERDEIRQLVANGEKNIYVAYLYGVTGAAVSMIMNRKGAYAKGGEGTPMKLTDKQVVNIRKAEVRPFIVRDLAKKYKVSAALISRIRSGKYRINAGVRNKST